LKGRGVRGTVKGGFVSRKAAAGIGGLLLAALCAATFPARPAAAQGFSLPGSSVVPSPGASQLQTAPGSGGDVLLGKNTKGPYLLSWKQIDPDSETVTVDGITAQRGLDYAIDYTAGAVAFVKPLGSGSIARINYRYTVGRATANAGTLSLPIELSILQRESSSLRFTGRYKEGAPDKPNSGSTVFGLGADRKWGEGGEVSSLFLLSNSDENRDSRFWDRAAVKFGGSRSTGKLRLRTAYERSGEGFTGAKEYALKEGLETTDVGASYAASSRLMMDTSYTQVRDVAGQDKGSSKTSTEQRVAYALSEASTIAAGHKLDESRAPDGTSQNVDIERLEAAHTFNTTTSAGASLTTTRVANAGAEVASETAASFRLQSSDKLQLQGSHVDTESEALGGGSATRMILNAKPTDTVRVDADYTRASSEAAGEQLAAGMKVEASPDKRVRVQAQYRGEESSLTGDQTLRAARVEVKPTEKISLAAGISERATADLNSVTREARMELIPRSWLQLGGGVLYIDEGFDLSTITNVKASIRPTTFLSLSGGYTDREMADPLSSLDTVALDFSWETLSCLKIRGSYLRNPEDVRTGAPLAIDSRSLGLETRLGILSLTGAYARKNDRIMRSFQDEKNLGVGLRLSRHGKLTGSYRLADAYLLSRLQTETLSLGYTRSLGSDFSLVLSGQRVQSNMGHVLYTEPEYEAEAKLGIRF